MTLHKRIEEALGWKEGEASTFSLPTLREMVRPVNPKLGAELDFLIRSGESIIGEKERYLE